LLLPLLGAQRWAVALRTDSPVCRGEQRAVNLRHRLALLISKCRISLGTENKIADVHRLQLRFIEDFPQADQQGARKRRNVFIRRMPVRGGFSLRSRIADARQKVILLRSGRHSVGLDQLP
jgi:hypothetical protein